MQNNFCLSIAVCWGLKPTQLHHVQSLRQNLIKEETQGKNKQIFFAVVDIYVDFLSALVPVRNKQTCIFLL